MKVLAACLAAFMMCAHLMANDRPEVGKYIGEKGANSFIELKADGAFTLSEGAETIEGKYSLSGSELRLKMNENQEMTVKYGAGVIHDRSGSQWKKAGMM